MYIDVVPNRNSPPAVLLREAFREAGKVRKRTLANLSSWPPAQVETLRQVLRGQALVPVEGTFETVRSRPHGQVAAVLGTLRRLGLDTLLGSKRSRERDLCSAMIVDRILEPRSKLATAQGLDPETLHSSLGEVLGLESAGEDELYAALDWLLARQGRIERELAARHLAEGTLTLYDLTSASRLVTFGCDVAPRAEQRREDWADVPAVSDGYEAARTRIVEHLRRLVDDLAATR